MNEKIRIGTVEPSLDAAAPTEDEKTKKRSRKLLTLDEPAGEQLPQQPPEKKPSSKHKKTPKKDYERFFPSPDRGLSQKQVDGRMEDGLNNKSTKKYSKTYRSIFIGNICTFFNLLGLIAAFFLMLARASISQYMFVIIFAVNIFWGIFQEIRAKVKIDRLTVLTSSSANVIRDGKKTEIGVNEIVIDDIIVLTAGQQVPCDCIAVDGQAELNEALLTGESVPIKKDVSDPLYAGSFVASGKILARVDKVSEDTYISKLTSKAKAYKRPKSEIMNSITMFIKVIGFAIVPLAIMMFFNNYAAQNNLGFEWSETIEHIKANGGFFKLLFEGEPGTGLSEVVQNTAAVVLGMIPSGLLLLTTIAMSLGMIRLTKYNTLVQDMYSLEMLARVNVLCLDKTGTITDGRMKVSDCILLNNPTNFTMDEILGSMLASLDDNNQTSIALYERFGHSTALSGTARIPFSSQRKMSAVTFGDHGTFVLGAPEFVLKPMPAKIDKLVKQYAQMGLRVMAVAHSQSPIVGEKIPHALRAVCLITLADNIRPDAVETIKWFKENDVAVKVISGDNPVTVAEVARRAGIRNASQFISLEGLSEIEVENAANQYTVFGRVTPEQKAILIRAIKKAGNTVAMTGDGVNDILAMKDADCAISVASGSEAAKNVSNLVLQDNNFGSMPMIVYEGRRVINNIKESASLYIMKTLLTALLALTCIFVHTKYFFKPSNMMLYEMFVSAIPSLALSLQPNTERVKGKFIPFVISRALPGALTMGLCIFTIYVIGQIPELSTHFQFSSNPTLDPMDTLALNYGALMMLTLTATGLVMLYRICQPFNAWRTVLFVVSLALCVLVLAVPFFTEFIFQNWGKVDFEIQHWLLLIILVQASLPMSCGLIKFFDMFNPAD
ncbi:MAG: HAD-IC family P-type ATPase [Clostridia bacterium]|nr:HAD-IC family P-type ATPase [Clostridia bacterium]